VTTDPLTDAERLRVADVADLYYVQGLGVKQVGERLGLSRSTVSRMLAKARRHGVVEFVLHPVVDRAAVLAGRLDAQFGVRSLVVPAGDSDDVARLELVAERAAARLVAVVGSDMTVAVAWGSTVEAMATHLTPSPTRGARVVQLNGSGNTYTSGLQYAGRLLDRFAMAFSASAHPFPVPAFFDSAATREAMWRERSVHRLLTMRRDADVTVSSVGALDAEAPGHLYRSGYLDDDDFAALRRQGVVGDLGSVFLRADGSEDGIDLNARTTGMPVAELRAVRTRLVVAARPAKAVAVAAALRAGAVTDLVVDDRTAAAVLAL
jgi:DNA-binding transcriptional regulator LsrR (DeoR family)